jgi:hypothetical protein
VAALVTSKADSGVAFLWWCVAGAGLCLGVVSLLSIGAFVLLATFVLCGVLLWRLEFGWGMAGLLSGAALPMFFLAWLNREGPGEVCHADGQSISCSDEWSPWPWVVAGVVLVVAGIVVFVRGRRAA